MGQQDTDHRKVTLTQKKLIRLESQAALFYVLNELGIREAKPKADYYWNEYMAFLGELMSKAY